MEVKIEYKDISEIIPYENNPRKHPKKQIELLIKSIKEYGFVNPIIVDKNNVVIAGHGRLEAVKKMGIKRVPVIKAEHLTEEQIRAYRLADNKLIELGNWDKELLRVEFKFLEQIEDFDIELTGFKYDEYLKLKKIEEKDEKIPYIDKSNVFTKKGDIYILDNKHRIICGDSTEAETYKKLMEDKKADMIYTDPPYGVSYTGVNNPNGRNWQMIKNDELRGGGTL